ncbi:hypothetical protein MASR2M18_10390 [Ignavibacteria bacterium]|nr:hypothetical protein [Bacteroidota bacterium]MCZ2133032.1 hypothetical protein [Bacteroidota bacterium]
MKLLTSFALLFILLYSAETDSVYAAVGDTAKTVMYDSYRFYTVGDMRLDTAVNFPSAGKTYSNITLKLKLACPCAPLKGEWDYTVTFLVRRATGKVDSLGNPVYEFVEIARFITPYWKYKPAAMQYVWQWDVSDYVELLKGEGVIVRTDYSGYSQSAAFTAWFEFVEGTPPYTVKGIETLWQGSWEYGNPAKPIDVHTAGKKIKRPAGAAHARLKIITTGHGGGGTDNAAEFSDKTHTIWVGGAQRYSQRLWREDCMLNPVYPQDGTWPLSRGGWCPGDKITPWEKDVTEFVSSDDSTLVDYKFQLYVNQDLSKGASYSTAGQIIYVGEPNYKNNAALLEIMQPNAAAPYNRMNPICASPSIRIKNLGANVLRKMFILYNAKSGPVTTMPWTGSLKFLEEATVTLPPLNWENIFAAQNKAPIFEVVLFNPNDAPDEDTLNNYGRTDYTVPPIYYNEFEIRLLTNKEAAAQYSYTLKNSMGKIISEKSGFSDNTQYVDSLNLPDGCYELRFTNTWGYGLSWWLTQPSLGSGSLRLTSLGRQLLQFNGDFGGEIYHQFRVGPKPGTVLSADILDFGSVNLAEKKEMTLTITPKNSLGLEVSLPYLTLKNRGYSIKSTEPEITDKILLKYGDTLKINVEFAPTSEGNKTTNLNFSTNDQRNSSIQVKLNGWGGPITSVKEIETDNSVLFLEANPVIATDEISIRFGDYSNLHEPSKVVLNNMFGQEIATVFEGALSVEGEQITLKTGDFPAGVFYLTLVSGGRKITKQIVILR